MPRLRSPATAAANAQHYEVPARFFELVLGPRLKYSSGYWPAGVDSLAASEEAMLELTAERAGLADGQRILHSPVPIPPELREELDALGPVGFIGSTIGAIICLLVYRMATSRRGVMR